MDLPMRTMSFTGGYYKDKNKFAFIAADTVSGQNIVHCFSGPMTVGVYMPSIFMVSFLKATDVIAVVQKAYLMAQDLRADPFVIKRPMQPTPEALVPVFLPFEREREKLDAQMVVGYGQVRA